MRFDFSGSENILAVLRAQEGEFVFNINPSTIVNLSKYCLENLSILAVKFFVVEGLIISVDYFFI